MAHPYEMTNSFTENPKPLEQVYQRRLADNRPPSAARQVVDILKRRIQAKNSWGKNELLTEIDQAYIEHLENQ